MLSAAEVAPERLWSLDRRRYHQLGELGAFDGQRVQLVFGAVITMSPMGTPHSKLVRVLNRALVTQTSADDHEVLVQLPLAAADDSEPEPDLAVVRASRGIPDDHPPTALLVIEVADTSLKLDLGPKALLYAQCHVPEYWVVDVNAEATIVHTEPRAGRFRRVRRSSWTRTLRSTSVPGVAVNLAALLGR
ncbi:MAG: Uma2 family endonuclease [Myxococcaceae bacterium]|jgi:Uma2 family endonuclease|nr:Uma2 family endonuclease [Myxococcaceae bacterium]